MNTTKLPFIEWFIHLIHIAILKLKIEVQQVNDLSDYFKLQNHTTIPPDLVQMSGEKKK